MKPLNADILAKLGHIYLKLAGRRDISIKAANLDPSNKRAQEGIIRLGQEHSSKNKSGKD